MVPRIIAAINGSKNFGLFILLKRVSLCSKVRALNGIFVDLKGVVSNEIFQMCVCHYCWSLCGNFEKDKVFVYSFLVFTFFLLLS